METTLPKGANKTLFLNTLAFTICFAAWMLNGVLVTFLISNQVFDWKLSEVGFLIGIPVLTGALFRLPAGILTDKYGGKPVMTILIILCAIPMFLLGFVNSYTGFALCSFGFGLAGASFSVGIAYTSVWFPMKRQGIALGIFGAGNAGAAITTLLAPTLLMYFTNNLQDLEGWRKLPLLYGGVLVGMAILFYLFSTNKKPTSSTKTLLKQLAPLKSIRVWRFGLYYFVVFGCFVAFSQWLVPYFVNVYFLSLVTAGILASLFSFPSGIIRILGGWLSDKLGGRTVMYWVLGSSCLISFFLIIPKMEITSPGKGILAKQDGVITAVTSDEIVVDEHRYGLTKATNVKANIEEGTFIFPTKDVWHETIVKVGDKVTRKQLLAKGITKIYFQANVWVFAVLVILIGSIWGIGKAAVYKHIPEYYPEEVGVVGGIVGVIGGLGGFVCPIIFGYLLDRTGLWTSCWIFMFFLSLICLIWMHQVIQRKLRKGHPEIMKNI
ncbi:MAG: MFS transporter [Altibacter sp.]|uniref:MFS transporter n=1 Tax=Altibacter sp. TaxID=2024823 RepID=UPI001D4E5292|nr:MFS transporter [Altibacter sp.]MBZ0327726.1 MFS transporter [Altibacter sp.]